VAYYKITLNVIVSKTVLVIGFWLKDLEVWQEYEVHGYIIVYSITDRRSYQKAGDVLTSIKYQHTTSNTCPRPIILVANKSDLERSRMIGKEGQYSLTLFVQYVRYAEQSRYRPTIFSMSACLSAHRRLVCLRRIRTTLMAVTLPEKCI